MIPRELKSHLPSYCETATTHAERLPSSDNAVHANNPRLILDECRLAAQFAATVWMSMKCGDDRWARPLCAV